MPVRAVFPLLCSLLLLGLGCSVAPAAAPTVDHIWLTRGQSLQFTGASYEQWIGADCTVDGGLGTVILASVEYPDGRCLQVFSDLNPEAFREPSPGKVHVEIYDGLASFLPPGGSYKVHICTTESPDADGELSTPDVPALSTTAPTPLSPSLNNGGSLSTTPTFAWSGGPAGADLSVFVTDNTGAHGLWSYFAPGAGGGDWSVAYNQDGTASLPSLAVDTSYGLELNSFVVETALSTPTTTVATWHRTWGWFRAGTVDWYQVCLATLNGDPNCGNASFRLQDVPADATVSATVTDRYGRVSWPMTVCRCRDFPTRVELQLQGWGANLSDTTGGAERYHLDADIALADATVQHFGFDTDLARYPYERPPIINAPADGSVIDYDPDTKPLVFDWSFAGFPEDASEVAFPQLLEVLGHRDDWWTWYAQVPVGQTSWTFPDGGEYYGPYWDSPDRPTPLTLDPGYSYEFYVSSSRTVDIGDAYHNGQLREIVGSSVNFTPGLPTEPGSQVAVPLEGGALTVGFDTVSTSGLTGAVKTPAAPEPAPAGFSFLGTHYDVSTTATFTGPVTITLHYGDTDVPAGTSEDSLRLLHYDVASWVDVTTSLDTVNNTISGQCASLSPFALAVPFTIVGPLQPINADGSSIFKQRSAVPVKFRLLDGSGAPVADQVATLTVAKVGDAVSGGTLEPFITAPGDTDGAFRYDAAAGQYIYNLKGLSQGTWILHIEVCGISKDCQIKILK